jgi:Glycosyl transferases group 1
VLAEYGPVAAEVDEGCMRAGVPLVVHFHGYDAFRHDVLCTYGEAYHSLFRRRRPIVVVSESMRQQLMALGAAEDQVFLNPCGVDLELFQPGKTERGLVVAVGRFIDEKAPELTVLAFSKVLERVPEARLVMIGDGPLRPAVERVISGLGVGDRVRLLGAQDHAHVVELMRRAAVFMQHSVIAPMEIEKARQLWFSRPVRPGSRWWRLATKESPMRSLTGKLDYWSRKVTWTEWRRRSLISCQIRSEPGDLARRPGAASRRSIR